MAFADPVLEIPQMNAPVPTEAPAASEASAPSRSSHHAAQAQRAATAPMPANLGSIDDYEHQDGDDSSSYSARAASSGFGGAGAGLGMPGNFGGANLQFDRGNDRQALANNLVLGALVLGLFAMEVQASHHHHHHR